MKQGTLYCDNTLANMGTFPVKKDAKTLQSVTDHGVMNLLIFAVSGHHQIFAENVDKKL